MMNLLDSRVGTNATSRTARRIVTRRLVRGAAARAAVVARAAEVDPMIIRVSGPLTGQYARYGADRKHGFGLTIAEVYAVGGAGGRRNRSDSLAPETD